MSEPLLSIKDLQVRMGTEEKLLLSNVNLEVKKGEIVGLIGESGSGKSLTARTIIGLLPSAMKVSGHVFYEGADLLSMNGKEHRKRLGNRIGIIFQDYRGSFTPFIKIGKQMVETICTHKALRKKDAQVVALRVLEEMGLDSERVFRSYPFQLSGGQVQRAAIATAIALKPALLICDEMTTALDVMNGENVLTYIEQIRNETGCAVLMITHDLTQAYKRTDQMYVMHHGQVVEEGLPEQIRYHPKHPYTKKLCSSLLSLPTDKLAENERVNVL